MSDYFDWSDPSGFIVTAKDVRDLAQEQYQELIGYSPRGEAHRPPRNDVQKYKNAFEEWSAYHRTTPKKLSEMTPELRTEMEARAVRWMDKAHCNPVEESLVDAYKNIYQQGWPGYDVQRGDAQAAFELMPKLFGEHGIIDHMNQKHEVDEIGGPEGVKKLLGSGLKKYEYGQYPKLYSGILDTLADLYRTSHDSYKLWPWAVNELKREFAAGIWQKSWIDNHSSNQWPRHVEGLPDRQHLVDIVNQTGSLLHELRQQNRVPQGVDANNFKSLGEMEHWLMDFRRNSGEGDAGGKTVHQFGDGWKVMQLNQPGQLEWEGETMDHCVGGYWQPVRDGKSFIYSMRDGENKPHATLEFKPPYDDHTPYELVEEYDPEEGQRRFKEEAKHDPELNEVITPLFDTQQEFGAALEQAKQGHEDWQNYPGMINAAALLPFAKKVGRFKKMAKANEPFAERSGKPLYRPIGYTGEYPRGMVPLAEEQGKLAVINQHMGPHDQTPNDNANAHIREWFDHHRGNGWNIERSDNFFYPNNWNHSGERAPERWYDDDYGQLRGIHNNHQREHTGATRMLDDWYNDYFRQNPERWTGQSTDEGDIYGLPNESGDEDGMHVDWTDLDSDVMRVLADEYDPGINHHHDWEGLAKKYWHAWNLDGPWDGRSEQQREEHKQSMEKKIEDWQENISSHFSQNWYDYQAGDAYTLDRIREQYGKLGYPLPTDEDGEERDDFDGDDVDEDDWREAEDQVRAEDEDATYGNNWKFLNYLYWLNEKHGPMTPAQLYNHHVNNTFPKWEDVRPPDPPQALPGALSRVAADDLDWMYEQPVGQWYKWGWNPDHGALVWAVNGQDGNKDDMQAGRAHIDTMNRVWSRGTQRYPFHPADKTGVAFHKPETNQVFVTQYPRGAGDGVAQQAFPHLEEKIRANHPAAQIIWPDAPDFRERTSEYMPSFAEQGMNWPMAWVYDPHTDETHWGTGHGVIDSRLYRERGYGPVELRRTLRGRYYPRENTVDVHGEPDPAQAESIRSRILQEAAQRPWERPSGLGSPQIASTIELPDTPGYSEVFEAMRQAYGGDVVDLHQFRNERGCPVCGGHTERVDPAHSNLLCRNCGWRDGDPVQTCPNCSAKNTIDLTSRFAQWPYECSACREVFSEADLSGTDRPT